MYTLYQICLQRTHVEVGVFVLHVVGMKYKFASFCINNVYILVKICNIFVEGGFGRKI